MDSLFKLIVQDADIVVPDTGVQTAGSISNGVADIIGIILAGICLTIILGIVSLAIIKHKKVRASVVVAIIAGLAITAPITNNAEYFADAAMKKMDITVSDTITATINREKGETFAVVPVDITLNEATDNGYELYMYGGELTDGTNTISLVSVDGSKITDGTWGVVVGAESAPAIDDEAWNQIGTPSSPKKVSTVDGEITAGSTVRVYYGVAIDDSTPAGTYTTTVGFQLKHDVDMTLGEAFEDAEIEKVPVGPTPYYPIQAMTTEICNNATIPSTLEVVDTRDNTIYIIGKLADDRCWLLDNMRLDLVTASVESLQGKTNAPDEALSYLKGVTSRNPDEEPEGNYAIKPVQYGIADHHEWTYDFSLSVPKIWVENKDDMNSNDVIEDLRTTRYGILYNFCAASAGSYCYGDGQRGGPGYDYPVDGQNKPNTAIDAPYDICPTGWRLPTGLVYDATDMPDGGEWQSLYAAYNNNGIATRTAANLSLASYFDFSGGVHPESQGSIGDYWSSTFTGPRYMAMTYVFDDYLYFGGDGYRLFAGMSVRCIAK